MKSTALIIISVLLLLSPVYSAKYAGDAFSLGVGARGLALGGAVVAGPFDGSAPYWNPAGLNRLEGRYITAMHAETFGSLLNHDFIAYVDSRGDQNSRIKSFGFYFYYLGGGGIKITDLDQFNRPYVVREESHGDYLLAGSLSGSLNDKLDFGITAKIIYRDIGTETGKGLTLDAGLLYRAHNNIDAALMVSDVTTGFIRYSGESFDDGSNSESIYPTVKPGLMFHTVYKQFTGRFLVSGDMKFEHLDEAAQYSAGSLSLDTHFGWEVSYNEMLFTRAGFDIGQLTLGGGVDIKNITIDFAWLNNDDFDETYRVSAGYRF